MATRKTKTTTKTAAPAKTSAKKATPAPRAKAMSTATAPVDPAKKAARARKPKADGQPVDLTPQITLTHDQIAARAFEVWQRKGRPNGQDAQNWAEAEAELKRELGVA